MLERLTADPREVTGKLRELGYRDIILDPKGYRSGSLDEGLQDRQNEGLDE